MKNIFDPFCVGSIWLEKQTFDRNRFVLKLSSVTAVHVHHIIYIMFRSKGV